jgi:hypothetical protein
MMPRMFVPASSLLFTALLAACGDDGGSSTPTDAGAVDTGGELDAGMPDTGVDAGPPDVCDELALPRTPMRAATGTRLGEVAGDFTVHVLGGDTWRLSERWTG